jgi:carbon-monoxide dehydrogenase small subunit
MNLIEVRFKVNGKEYCIKEKPLKPLSKILRENLNLTGTKEGCGKGECGACTVILNNKIVNSCLVPFAQINGAEIITIEGITPEKGLNPLQKAFIEEGAIQCGFCTPGMIISAYSLLKKKKIVTDDEIKEAISGNLCRCTGYKKIISAIKKASKYFIREKLILK